MNIKTQAGVTSEVVKRIWNGCLSDATIQFDVQMEDKSPAFVLRVLVLIIFHISCYKKGKNVRYNWDLHWSSCCCGDEMWLLAFGTPALFQTYLKPNIAICILSARVQVVWWSWLTGKLFHLMDVTLRAGGSSQGALIRADLFTEGSRPIFTCRKQTHTDLWSSLYITFRSCIAVRIKVKETACFTWFRYTCFINHRHFNCFLRCSGCLWIGGSLFTEYSFSCFHSVLLHQLTCVWAALNVQISLTF